MEGQSHCSYPLVPAVSQAASQGRSLARRNQGCPDRYPGVLGDRCWGLGTHPAEMVGLLGEGGRSQAADCPVDHSQV